MFHRFIVPLIFLTTKNIQNSLASVFIKNDIAILGFGTYFVNLNRTQSSIDHHEKIKNWKLLSLFSLIECCFGSTDHCQINKTSFLNVESSLIIQNIMSITFKFETFFWQSVKNQRHKKNKGFLILQLVKHKSTKTTNAFCFQQPHCDSCCYYWHSLGFYNSKILNCIGALSLFKDLCTHFHDF